MIFVIIIWDVWIFVSGSTWYGQLETSYEHLWSSCLLLHLRWSQEQYGQLETSYEHLWSSCSFHFHLMRHDLRLLSTSQILRLRDIIWSSLVSANRHLIPRTWPSKCTVGDLVTIPSSKHFLVISFDQDLLFLFLFDGIHTFGSRFLSAK